MDKNKSRTDMLAVGRKKLQQFRQKKDGKGSGSQGKSSKKSGKTDQREADAEVESAATKHESPSFVPEQGIASHGDSDPPIVVTSMSHSTENVAPDTDVAVDNLSAVPSSQESSAVEADIELSTSIVEIAEHNVDSIEKAEVLHTGVTTAEMARVTPVVGSDTMNSEEETARNTSESINSPEQPSSIDSTGKSVDSEENVLALREVTPDTSLVQARGDQEADGLDGRQSNYNSELELGGDSEVPLPEHGKTAEASPGASLEETRVNTSGETDEAENIDEASVVDVAKMSELSGAALASDEVEISSARSVVENQQNEGKPEQSSGRDEAQDVAREGSVAHGYNQQHVLDDYPKFRETDLDTSAAARVASHPDLSSISLSQLINLMRGLSEEEFNHILESRKPVSGAELGTGNMPMVDNGFQHLLEMLKEELVLTNFTKDISQMQLAQHSELQGEFDDDRCRLVDEIAQLNASLKETSEENQRLSEELSGCKYELQAVVSAREELQNQFHASQDGVQELSCRANELQINLERSQGEILNLTTELADCKNLVGSLRAENEILNGNIASATEERNKLKEKDSQFGELEKLLAELIECKTSLAVLLSENSNLTASCSLLAAERKMAEEEKENLCTEYEKLSTEFADCKGLASALQLENSSLTESLDLVREDRKKFEEEKRYFAQENERLSSELHLFQEKISSEQRERERVEVELKETSMRLEEIIEENIFLSSSLEVHKARLAEADRSRLEMPLQSSEAVHQVEISDLQSRGFESAAGEDSRSDQGKQDGEVCSSSVQKPLSGGSAGQLLLRHEVPTGFVGFDSLRAHLEEAEKILHQLEKANEGIQTLTVSFGKPGGKSATPGVSKLIQAFESKVQTDEQEAEQTPLAETKSTTTDPFVLMKEETRNLKTLFKKLVVDATDACALFKEECDGRRAADVTLGELKDQYEALKDHSNSLEATNIELSVLCEVVKQHGGSVEAINKELSVLSEATKQEVMNLKAENAQLGSKLRTCESRIGELQFQLDDLQRTSNEAVAVIGSCMEALEKDVSERVLILEQDWNSILTQVVEIVQKLSESTGYLSSTVLVPDERLDVVSHVAALVNETIKVIQDLQKKVGVAQTDHEVISMSFKELNQRCDELHQKNDLAAGILQNIHFHLKKLVNLHGSADESEKNAENEKIPDPLDYGSYGALFQQLEHFLIERLELESAIKKLNSELMDRETEFEELERGSLHADIMFKLIESVEGVLKLEDADMHLDELPASRFESLVSTLVQKYKEAHEQLCLSKDEFGSTMAKSTELQEEIQQLIGIGLQHDTEISVLKESLDRAEEALFATGSELQKKTSELEQSEQRVSSLREKLSIAVAKGKGLVVQRDGLKQSLAEMSSELERCMQELQLKDARLHEVEAKLKTYSEAGERVEALETELSYIRNSATGLRESFLLKDSVLQRIEEILEDLDLPEHFHSRDILEKVEWLARSASGNALPTAEWDQKSSAGGGSYSETGFVSVEPWKEDAQSSSNSGEDLKRKYEELQSKFYGLAEQNEMLEQSLMERNDLVQKWEELLDQIDMPSHLRSLEPEDRIKWLGRALSDAHHGAISLREKVVNFENYCGSLNADLEDSQGRISDLETNLEAITRENEYISERLEILHHDYEKVSLKATQYEVENKRLQSEVTRLEESHEKLSAKEAEVEMENERLRNEVNYLQENVAEMLGNKEQILNMEGEIRRLQSLVSDVLQDHELEDHVSSGSSVEGLEAPLKKLLEKYVNFSSAKHVVSRAVDVLHDDAMMTEEAKSTGTPDAGDSDIAILKKELDVDDALNELTRVKGERDMYVEKQHSLGCEIEALVKRREELELLLSQEEQRSASVREKLNVAVRKGKSVVQQRDSLKQTIEAMNGDMENLKSEIDIRESKLSDYENRFRELSSYPDKVEVLESEILSLKNRSTETEQHLQEMGHTLSLLLNNLAAVDLGDGVDSSDPVKKLEQIVKLCRDLHADLTSSEEESRKSKRAAELLLAELNEVQERNDNLQDGLAITETELSRLTNERDVAEAAKREAHSRLEELYDGHSLEQRNQFSELKVLKSGVDHLRKGFHDVSNLLVQVCSKDLEFLLNLEKSIGMSLNPTSSADGLSIPAFSVGNRSSSSDTKGLFASIDSWFDSNAHSDFDGNSVSEICGSVGLQLQELTVEVGALKEKLQNHASSLHEQAGSLSKSMTIAQRELTSRHDAMQRELVRVESASQEKDNELVLLRKNFALLFEVLSGLITEIQSTKAELLGNNLATGDIAMNLKSAALSGEGHSGGADQIPSEESIKTMADKLLFAVRDFANVKAEILEGNKKQMKIAIADLQKELQEKEIQKERICMDLVGQIKVAEAATARYLADLQSSSRRVDDLENRLKQVERERHLMEQKANELLDVQATSTELQQKIRSLADVIAAKDQEIEAMMQALDEEETQMEDHAKKIEELERALQQKNLDLENVESSRGKVMKKLSITVSKFDELHQLSASLLAEVEKLQSQLQDRDAEISFLRQEVTRCTNEVLVASQLSNKRGSDDILEFSTWLDMIIANAGMQNVHLQAKDNDQVQEHKELLKKKIESVISELVDVREVAQSKDTLFQAERSRVEELARKEEILQRSLRDKETRLNLLEGVGTSEGATGMTSEIVEVEPLINKWTVPGPLVTSQVRSLRKANNDQVAISIDMDTRGGNKLEDEDDDKVHGFKSLTTSRIVPRFTRPVSDMVDGLWVSCDRALMRQPALRLGIIIYWAVLHALLATLAI